MTPTRPTHRHGLPLDERSQRRLRALVERLGGAHHVARLLGVGAPTVARALGGIGLRAASATAIRLALDALDDDEQTEPTAA